MAGESDIIGQAEIEALLRQARAATPPAASNPSAAPLRSMPQDDLNSLADAATVTTTAPLSRGEPPRPGQSPGDDIQFLLDQAEAAIASVNQPNPSPAGLTPFSLSELSGSPATTEKATLDLLRDVELGLRIELGRTSMYLEEVLKLKRGSVVTLDKLAGDPVDVYVNGRLIARGEVLVLNDNFCVRVAELVSGDDIK